MRGPCENCMERGFCGGQFPCRRKKDYEDLKARCEGDKENEKTKRHPENTGDDRPGRRI